MVGWTIEEGKLHFEKLWKPEMCWANYGELWEIDHIIPKALWEFSSAEDSEFKQCWSLANLQPLLTKDNRKKSSKSR